MGEGQKNVDLSLGEGQKKVNLSLGEGQKKIDLPSGEGQNSFELPLGEGQKNVDRCSTEKYLMLVLRILLQTEQHLFFPYLISDCTDLVFCLLSKV